MKTKMMIAVLLIGTMVSCSKRGNNKDNAANEQQSEMYTLVSPEPNRNNSYDSAGIRHNILLEALRNYQKETNDTTRAGRKRFFIRAVQARTGRLPDVDPDKVDRLFQRAQQVGLARFLNSQTTLSDQVKQYFVRLDEMTRTVKSTDLFPSFLNEVSDLEHDVMESDLPQRDRQATLKVSSIAYHSALFWKNVYDTNTWLNPSPQIAEMKWWHWPVVIQADLIGGILGVVLGCDVEDAAGWMSGGAEGTLGFLF